MLLRVDLVGSHGRTCERRYFSADEGHAVGAALQPVLRLAHGLVSSFQLNYLAVAFLALEWGPTLKGASA
jgi:hypothetical protein